MGCLHRTFDDENTVSGAEYRLDISRARTSSGTGPNIEGEGLVSLQCMKPISCRSIIGGVGVPNSRKSRKIQVFLVHRIRKFLGLVEVEIKKV